MCATKAKVINLHNLCDGLCCVVCICAGMTTQSMASLCVFLFLWLWPIRIEGLMHRNSKFIWGAADITHAINKKL